VTLLPRHRPLRVRGQSVTHVSGIRCYLWLRKDTHTTEAEELPLLKLVAAERCEQESLMVSRSACNGVASHSELFHS
jgi:hypothetical protein